MADRNCVVKRRGGEQRKAKGRSVGDEPDSVSHCDEPSGTWRNLEQLFMLELTQDGRVTGNLIR